MSLPKVKFRPMTLEENIENIKQAYFSEGDVHNYTIKYYKELASIGDSLSDDKIVKTIEKAVEKKYKENIDLIKEDVKRYNSIWNNYNDLYFEELSNYFKIDWPLIDTIDASVGLIAVFPRYLDSFAFSVGTKLNDSVLIRVVAHETLHFMWFQKWRVIYPEISRNEYEAPYLSWQYSEMVTDTILNNKPFTSTFNNAFKERSYEYFYSLYDGNELVMNKLDSIFCSDCEIEEKMKLGFEYLKKYYDNK